MTPDIEHLGWIQGVIERLARNSFVTKGWSITLTGALVAASSDLGGPRALVMAITVAAALGWVDGTYLALERQYRGLWARAIRGDVEPYSLAAGPARPGDVLRAMASTSVALVHGLPAVIAAALLTA